jgi:S-layer family protein
MKKVLSLVLVLAMVLSSMSFAFASNLTDIADNDYEKAIETLVGLGVITGYEDGTFRPEKTITRAEMAKLMVITLGYGDLVAGSRSNFADTQGHWADAYVALAAGKGIVVGDGNGKFRPDATVTYNEVFTMLVRGLGYTDTCNELKGMTWPTNFKVKAAELGITDDVAMNATGADRGGVAQAIFNALNSTLVTVNSDGDVTLMVDRNENQVELFSRLADLDENYDVTSEVLDPLNKNYGGDLVDLTPYMFQNLDVYTNDDDEVVYIKDSNSLVYEGTIDDVTTPLTTGETPSDLAPGDETTVGIEDANGKVKEVDFETESAAEFKIDAAKVFENGALRDTDIDYDDLKDTDTIKIVAMEDPKDDNGKIEESEVVGFVTTIQTDVVRVEKEYVEGKAKLDGLVLPTDDDDEVDLANITVKGAVDSLEDIKVDDIVVEYLAEDESVTTLVVTRDTVEGKVTRIDDSNTYYIDGVKYDTADVNIDDTFALGDEGVFYLNHDGDIVDYDGESAGPTDYAVVIGKANGEADAKFGSYSIDTYPQLKLATQDDETIIYDIEVDMDTDGTVSGSAEVDGASSVVTAGNIIADNETALAADGSAVAAATARLAITGDIDQYDLVKYSLNKDGRISDIEVVKTGVNVAGNYTSDLDLEKSTNTLTDGVIVFDATGNDYDVVDADVLGSEVDAIVVRNDDGDIEVLIAKDGQIDDAASVVYAYIYNVDSAYDDNGDKVQFVNAYTDGADKGIYSDAKNVFTLGEEKVYAIDYDGDVIEEATAPGTYSVAADGTVTGGLLNGGVVTASAVNAKGAMIQIDGTWYAMSEHATVMNYDLSDAEEDGLADLYDVDKATTNMKVYLNTDKEIDLIVIQQP